MAENIIKVSTGAKTYGLVDADGEEIGSFKFNPSDLDIGRRYEQVQDWLMSVHFEGEDPTKEEVYAFTDDLCERFDFLMGYHVSETLFKVCNPLTPTENGDTYVEVLMDAIADVIIKETETRVEKKAKRIKKATAKYHTQDHKKAEK